MLGLNCVHIMGNLGADPEMRYTPSGRAVTNLRVAVSRRWRDNDGQLQERTEWFRVVVWGRQAEIANQYLEKGSPVYIQGRLETHSYQDAQNETRYMTELIARNLILLPRGNGRRPGEPEQDLEPAEKEELFELAL
ncbi:MAG: single-stranded DNA-binding protein [Chloroflexia bacterium]|nr:single-stranded DNA-binding protein [Chloroflexia bacterium]